MPVFIKEVPFEKFQVVSQKPVLGKSTEATIKHEIQSYME